MSTYKNYDDIYIYTSKLDINTYISMCTYIKKNMYIVTNIYLYIEMYFFCCDSPHTCQLTQMTCPSSAK